MSEITPPVGPDPRDLTVKGRATHAAIVAAARSVFGRMGRDGLSHASVAAAAGMGRGTVYRYFPLIEGLLAKLEQDAARYVAEVFITRYEGRPHGRARLRSCLSDILRVGLRDVGLARLCLQALREMPEIGAVATSQIRADLRVEGRGDPDVMARLIVAALTGLLDALLMGRVPWFEAEDAAAQLMRMTR